jgi:hypothetical protein
MTFARKLFLEALYNSNNIVLNHVSSYILSLNQQRKLSRTRVVPSNVSNFSIDVSPTLPALAWVCEVHDTEYLFTIGRDVEYGDDFLVEGVWDGNFSEINFDRSEFVFGSGARYQNGRVMFVPPKNCAESLFVLCDESNGAVYVSNSMCAVIERAGLDDSGSLARLEDQIEARLKDGIARGIDLYDPLLLKSGSVMLYQMYFYNFSLSDNGDVKLFYQRPHRYFRTYTQYRDFLINKTHELFENGSDPSRHFTLKPITSISRGYDSPAVSVIGKEAGCKEAVTIDVHIMDENDNGTEIGNALSIDTTSFPHVLSSFGSDASNVGELYVDTPSSIKNIAYEFLATTGAGDDITFAPFKDAFHHRIFISGVYGDFVWGKNTKVTPGLPKHDVFGKGITEFRLNNSYTHIPLPCLGTRFASPLAKISRSREMTEFSIGGDYDRPIPRRITEEAGVPREAFGMTKRGTAPYLLDRKTLFQEALASIRTRYRK